MDYRELANEIVLDMLQDSGNNNRVETEPFSSGEMKMLGSLLLFKDGMTAGELCQKMNVSTARIAQILNTLEKKGSVCRKANSADKRVVYAYLTEEGREFAKKRYDDFVVFVSRLFSSLGEEETKEYIRLSTRVKQIIEEMDSDFEMKGSLS